MRVLTPWFVGAWADRLINIHPSLLPAFPGLDTHRRALGAGVRFHGCTVHFVRADVDSGPIVVQAAVPVLPDDDEARLAARVLAAEHRCYPLAVRLVAEGRVRIVGGRAVVEGAAAPRGAALNPCDCASS
jgi:phosphoribosylglycinamide formyltransferase-1